LIGSCEGEIAPAVTALKLNISRHGNPRGVIVQPKLSFSRKIRNKIQFAEAGVSGLDKEVDRLGEFEVSRYSFLSVQRDWFAMFRAERLPCGRPRERKR
jgi:hypothetical protein